MTSTLSRPTVAAAKLHVLQLDPIRARLGERWARLSVLVHALFERKLRQVQGPSDHFLRTDEMSYVVSFHALSVEEASLACAAVAREVCELLFGADIEDIGVRTLVGRVSPDLFQGGGTAVSVQLEAEGIALVVKHQQLMSWSQGDWIEKAHGMVRQVGRQMAFFPVWNLSRHTSASLYLSVCAGRGESLLTARRACGAAGEAQVEDTEAALLFAAADYAHALHRARKVCALGVGVSYETMSGLHSRIRYLQRLQTVRIQPDCPLVIRIEKIPDGTPLARIAEMTAMITVPNVRVSLEFADLRHLPPLDIRMGAAGIGGALPPNCDAMIAAQIAHRLAHATARQPGYTFLHGLKTPAMVAAAREAGVRLGSGAGLCDGRYLTGDEALPEFPLTRRPQPGCAESIPARPSP